MKCTQECARLRFGRIVLAAIVVAFLIAGACLIVRADEEPKNESYQTDRYETDGKGVENSKTSRIDLDERGERRISVVAGKKPISAEEIRARFPQEKHEEFMRRAIANSRKAGVEYKTGGAFGAVIVDKNGDVLADGINHVVAENDPTWHGEMHAIRQACNLLKKPKLEGCILYTSSEPCPMCLATAYWAGLDGIIYGATVADSKQYGNFDDAFIYEQLAKAAADRAISEQSMLRPEAVEVWKEYSDRTDKVDY